MTPQHLLSELHTRGIALTLNGDQLIVTPASRLTDSDRVAIRTHKPMLLGLLKHGGPQQGIICTSCDAVLEMVETARHRHTWCANPECVGFDRWEAIDGGTLKGAFDEPTGRQMMAVALSWSECPECQAELQLQDRERNVWQCPLCQVSFFNGVLQ